MYVQETDGMIQFRLWNSDDPKLWEEHGWIPYDAIQQASDVYEQKNDFNPNQVYNPDIAKAALKE